MLLNFILPEDVPISKAKVDDTDDEKEKKSDNGSEEPFVEDPAQP